MKSHRPTIFPKICFFLVIPLDHDHAGIAGFEVRVLVVERVPAHDDRAVWEVAEHAAGVFSRNGALRRQPTGWRRLASSKGFGTLSLTEISQTAGLAVELLDHAGQFIARMVLLPQVGDGSIHVALRKVHVVAVTLNQTPTRADGQHMARHTAARLVGGCVEKK